MSRTIAVLALAALAGTACRNFGDPPPPRLAVTPPVLEFKGLAGGLGPPRQPLTVDAVGGGSLAWEAWGSATWLEVTPARGTAPAVVWVGTPISGLATGVHRGRVTVVTTSGPFMYATVPVILTLLSEVSLDGRWAGATDTVTVSVNLAQADTVLSGLGTLNPPLTRVSVRGIYRDLEVSLVLVAPDSSEVRFAGSLVNENAIQGVLDGGRFANLALALFRQ